MATRRSIFPSLIVLVSLACLSPGCGQPYKGLVKPSKDLKALSPELAEFNDVVLEKVLKAEVKPSFPTVLAVAKLHRGCNWYGYHYNSEKDYPYDLETISGSEADGWLRLAKAKAESKDSAVSQVQFVNTFLTGGAPTLTNLRAAAAMVHAPLLLVYVQDDDAKEGYNDGAMAYWTIVGLFVVPGNTVGYYSTCQALIVDTQTGLVYATAGAESKREENVLAGAVEIAKDRVEKRACAEAVEKLQANVRELFEEIVGKGPSDAR